MKYKLDMLEPACKIFPIIGISFFSAVVFYLLKISEFTVIFTLIALVLTAVIFIGVIIELIQDDYLFKKHDKHKDQASMLCASFECEYCGARFNTRTSFCPVCGRSLKFDSKKQTEFLRK